jgi:hypothetical protein
MALFVLLLVLFMVVVLLALFLFPPTKLAKKLTKDDDNK